MDIDKEIKAIQDYYDIEENRNADYSLDGITVSHRDKNGEWVSRYIEKEADDPIFGKPKRKFFQQAAAF